LIWKSDSSLPDRQEFSSKLSIFFHLQNILTMEIKEYLPCFYLYNISFDSNYMCSSHMFYMTSLLRTIYFSLSRVLCQEVSKPVLYFLVKIKLWIGYVTIIWLIIQFEVWHSMTIFRQSMNPPSTLVITISFVSPVHLSIQFLSPQSNLGWTHVF
jgi:hypothetical protein